MGLDPVKLKKQFAARAEARKTDIQGIYRAETLYGDTNGVVQGWRVIRQRDDDVSDKNHNGLGLALFDAAGPFSVTGTMDQQGLTRWMAGYPVLGSEFERDSPPDNKAEVEIKTSDGWVNCVTGEVNRELIVVIDGAPTQTGTTTQPGI